MSLSETFLISPLSVPGCQLWLDAADPNGNGVVPANGATVSTWADKSGNSRNTNSVVGTPTYTLNSIISKRGVYFNGSSYFTGPFSYSSNLLSWFVVGTIEAAGEAFGRLLSLGSTGTFDFDSALRINALSRESTTTEIVTYRNNAYIGRGLNITYGSPFLFSDTLDGTTNFPYLNGTLGTTGASSGNFGFNTYGIGSSFGTSIQRNTGHIFEVIIYTISLATSDRQKIEGYLAWKWGLTGNLPSTHPYKNSRPLDNIPLPTSLLVPSRPLRNVFVFNPTVLSNCVLWLDGADVSTMFQDTAGALPVRSTGSTVALWRDKSVSANHASNTSAQPNVTFAAQNGLNVVNFTGAQYLTLSTSTLPTGTTECTFFFLTRTTNSGVQVFFTYGADPNASGRNPQFFYGNGSLNIDLYGGGSTSDSTNFLNSYVLTTCTFTRTTNTAWDNGSPFTGGSTAITLNTGTGWASIGVGRIPPGNVLAYYLIGQMGEMVVFNRVLSPSERQQMEGYLAWKWGLQTNLPVSHTFRANPPDLPAVAPRAIPQLKSAFFNPRNITGIQLWLDVADASSRTVSGGTVSQLNDKSGNNYTATQTVSASRPTLATNTLIQFANNTYLDFPQAAINNTTRYSLFLVFNPIASVNWILQKQYNGVGSYNMLSMTNFWQNNTGTTNFLYWGPHANTGVVNSGTALTLSTLQLIELVFDGTTLSFYRNGILLNTAVSGPTLTIVNQLSATNNTIGSWRPDGGIQNSGVTNFFFGELVYHNVFLSTVQRQAMEGYLAWKWRLQANLPSTHPFKLFPPSP